MRDDEIIDDIDDRLYWWTIFFWGAAIGFALGVMLTIAVCERGAA